MRYLRLMGRVSAILLLASALGATALGQATLPAESIGRMALARIDNVKSAQTNSDRRGVDARNTRAGGQVWNALVWA